MLALALVSPASLHTLAGTCGLCVMTCSPPWDLQNILFGGGHLLIGQPLHT